MLATAASVMMVYRAGITSRIAFTGLSGVKERLHKRQEVSLFLSLLLTHALRWLAVEKLVFRLFPADITFNTEKCHALRDCYSFWESAKRAGGA